MSKANLGAFLALLVVYGCVSFKPSGANGGDTTLDRYMAECARYHGTWTSAGCVPPMPWRAPGPAPTPEPQPVDRTVEA